MASTKSPAPAGVADVKVYIGRCNPFHLGHAHNVHHAIETSKLTIILLGSAGLARSLKNPFTFEERKQMIQSWLSHEVAARRLTVEDVQRVIIAPLRDYPYNNALWIRSVQRKVKDLVQAYAIKTDQILTDIRLIGSDRDDSTWYLKAFPQWKLELTDEKRIDGTSDLSATEVREIMFDGEMDPVRGAHLLKMLPSSTFKYLVDFAKTPEFTRLKSWHEQNKAYKQAWSVAPYAPIFTTVDAVIVQSGHILVVERGAEPGRGLWALPGGFVNQFERLKNAVVREVTEETGIRLASGKDDARNLEITHDILKNCIREYEVFDAPDRSMRGRTITHAYFIRLDDTKPLAKVKGQFAPLHETDGAEVVETAKAFWLPIDEALTRSDMWFEDHHAIIETLVGGKDL